MRCDIEVDDLTSVMRQDYETVQVAEGQRRNGAKVDGGNLLCMIGKNVVQVCEGGELPLTRYFATVSSARSKPRRRSSD